MPTDTRIRNAIDFIDTNFASDLRISELASVACLSAFHFTRLFSAQVGVPPLKYIQGKRIEVAKGLLFSTDKPITEIAALSGFQTLSNFNATFKKCEGVSPSAYRRLQNSRIQEEVRSKPLAANGLAPNHPVTDFFRRIIEMNLSEHVLPDMDVAYVSQKGSYFDTGSLWRALMQWAFPHGLLPPQHQYFGISYDEPEVPDDQKTSDACVILPRDFGRAGAGADPGSGVRYKTVPGGLFVKYAFYDTVERFGLVYKEVVSDYLPVSPYALDPARDFLEFVMNDPASDPERKVRIDLYVPVVRKPATGE